MFENNKKSIMTDEEKKQVVDTISKAIMDGEEFIFYTLNHNFISCTGATLLSLITFIMRDAKKHGASDEMLKTCYEIGKANQKEALEYMLNKLSKIVDEI